MDKASAIHALVRTLIISRMQAAQRTNVAGLPGVSISFNDTDGFSPRRLFVSLPNGEETWTDLVGDSDEEVAEDAARFLGLM